MPHPQAYAITPMEDQLPAVMHACLEATQMAGHKVIVFLTTARQTQLYAQVGFPKWPRPSALASKFHSEFHSKSHSKTFSKSHGDDDT